MKAFRQDREALKRLALDPDVNLSATVPAGDGQTYLRELLLAADHTAYHLGELVVVRRALGAWPELRILIVTRDDRDGLRADLERAGVLAERLILVSARFEDMPRSALS